MWKVRERGESNLICACYEPEKLRIELSFPEMEKEWIGEIRGSF